VKPWYVYLFDFLVGVFTKQNLGAAGAGPEALRHSTTLAVPLPAFASNPTPPVGRAESRDLEHLHPELLIRYMALKADFASRTGRTLFETCTWRSVDEQGRLFRRGRSGIPGEKKVTNCDGVTNKSRHNVFPSEAVDVCVDMDPGPGKHPVWDFEAYKPLGQLALIHGLRWGGDWNGNGSSADERLIDYPHLELPAGAA